MSNSTETCSALDAVRASLTTLEVVDERDGVKITRIVLEPGEEVPWHHHTEVTDTFYPVVGPLTIETRAPDGMIQIEAGQVFQTEVGQPHRVSNGTRHQVQFLLIQGGGEFDFVPMKS